MLNDVLLKQEGLTLKNIIKTHFQLKKKQKHVWHLLNYVSLETDITMVGIPIGIVRQKQNML